MRSTQQSWLAALLITFAVFAGCSDDDDNPTGPPMPEDPRVASIVVSPESATLDGIGIELQFNAIAFDQNEDVIDTVFVWTSSDPDVVVVDDLGNAVSAGIGTAEVYATAGSVTDTAQVIVTLDGSSAVQWIASGSGNWQDPANWDGGAVPGQGDVAVIDAAGSYTVTLIGDVEVGGLVLGDGSANPTLDTNGFSMRVRTGGMFAGAQLLVQNEFTVLGDFVCSGGDVSGGGRLEIASSGELHQTGNPVNVDAAIYNVGALIAYAGTSLRINDSLENDSGGLVELQGDAILSVQFNGLFTNQGTIQKSQGSEESSILVASNDDSDFQSSGTLQVDVGSLTFRDGTLQGRVVIEKGAILHQGGTTTIPRLNAQGEGDFVVSGSILLGEFENQVIDFLNLVLDSTSSPSLSGPAGALVNQSLVWRRGTVALSGRLSTQIHSSSTFEGSATKVLDGCEWLISGDVDVAENFELQLRNGAQVTMDTRAVWNQMAAGSITQGVGDLGRVDIIGLFEKTESSSTFTVDPDLICSGTMDIRAGAVVARGRFRLFDNAVLTGGGTGDLTNNVILNVVNATSADIRGIIRPDLDGAPARLDIQGRVNFESTATIELDVNVSDAFDTESVYFLTAGQEFGGTLALNVQRPPDQGSQFRVIHSIGATGTFDVEGGAPFTEIIQNGDGVLCVR